MKRIWAALIMVMLAWGQLMSQSPTHIDTRRKEPNPLTLDDILLYIVAPLLLIGVSLWYRYHTNRKRMEKELDQRQEKSGSGE